MKKSAPGVGIGRGKHLGPDAVGYIRACTKLGKSQTVIAAELGCAQGTVSKWVTAITDPLGEAKNRLREAAPKLAERVIKHADVDQSLETLDRLDVLPKRAQASNVGVQVMVNMPGQTQVTPPVIDLSPPAMQQLTELSTG